MAFAKYGLNLCEAGVNGVAGAVVLTLRSKKIPALDHMLKFGLEKAIINALSSIFAYYIAPNIGGVAQLDFEYLSSAIVAWFSSYWKPGYSGMYLAQEQMMVSLISHLIATKTITAGLPYINNHLGNTGIDKVNPNDGVYM